MDAQVLPVAQSNFNQTLNGHLLATFPENTRYNHIYPYINTIQINYCIVLYMGLPLKPAWKWKLIQSTVQHIKAANGY